MNNLEAKQERYRELIENIIIERNIIEAGIKKLSPNLYKLGDYLNQVKKRELYLLDCRNFEEFIRTKVALKRRTAYTAMSMAETYSLNDFTIWGVKKLDFIKRELPKEDDRKEFMNKVQQVAQTIKYTPLKDEISRFKTQVGIEEDSQEESDLKGIRQANKILAFKDNLVESLTNWLKGAESSQNEEIKGLRAKLKELLECLK